MKTIRIGTWNVDHAKPSRNLCRLDVLRKFNADIWVLTETHDDLDPGGDYLPIPSAPRAHAPVGERWVTIWSHYKCLETVAVHDAERTVAALYDTPFGHLVVYGTVLPWHADRGPTETAKNWTEQYRIVPEQAEEWASLRQRYSGAARCVAGDLNMNLGGPQYYGTKKGRDLLQQGLAGAELKCVTRTEFVPEGRLRMPNIDHVCLSAFWASRTHVADAWPGTSESVRLSDHSGIVVAVDRLDGSGHQESAHLEEEKGKVTGAWYSPRQQTG
jgi:hypothetical protein